MNMILHVLVNNLKKINPSLVLFYVFAGVFSFVPLLIVVVKAITPASNQYLVENFSFVNYSLWASLMRSLFVAVITIFFVLIAGYLFAYLVHQVKSKFLKNLMMMLATCPLWSSFFVKLIGLKSFFDLLYGEINSTRGLLYVIIGLIYLNLPIAILTIYNGLSNISKNIVNASLDLGYSSLETIGKVILPYTKKSIMATVSLVFLPSVTCVSVADFMNKSNGSKLISQSINDLISSGGKEGIGVHRLSFLTVFLIGLIFFCYVGFRCVKKIYLKMVFSLRHV